MEQNIEILYQDEEVIAVNKPVDLPIHKNDFMRHDAPYLNKSVGEITGKGVFNVHRIDAKTSGIVLLTFSSEMAKNLTLQFERKEVAKKYYAIVLNETEPEGEYDSKVVVKKKSKFKKNAITRFKTIKVISTGIDHKEQADTKISLVEINPVTGRWHQLRQHFANNRHDIVGDKHHGDFSFNRIITEKCGVNRLFLHAASIGFNHPLSGERIELEAELPEEFAQLMDCFK
jgi:tRNA pseudouridine65 synthase